MYTKFQASGSENRFVAFLGETERHDIQQVALTAAIHQEKTRSHTD
jgi:hypothetical protein